LNYVSVILAVLGKSVIIYGCGKAINELQARHRVPQKYVMLTTTSRPVSALHSSSTSLMEEKYLFTLHLFICSSRTTKVSVLSKSQAVRSRNHGSIPGRGRQISLVHSVKTGCVTSTVLFHGLFGKL